MVDSDWQLIIFAGFLSILSFVLPIYNEKINDFASSKFSETSERFNKFRSNVVSGTNKLKSKYFPGQVTSTITS